MPKFYAIINVNITTGGFMPSKKRKSRKKTTSSSSRIELMDMTQLVMMYLSFFIANSLVILAGNTVAPQLVALGTDSITPMAALVQSMLVFSLLTVAFVPLIELISQYYALKLQDKHWIVLFFFINAIALWVTARFAVILGLGISSWMVVVVIALLMDVAQGLGSRLFDSFKVKTK